MTGFFEAIKANLGKRELLAAWAADGPAAKEKVLYGIEAKGLTALSCEPEFFQRNRAAVLSRMQESAFSGTAFFTAEDSRVFLEMIPGERSLVICGAGHVALALVRMAALLAFEITVIDDREGFARKAAEAGADHVLCMPFEEALEKIASDRSTAFVIMTRDHRHDVECLHRILEKNRGYLGMMGSRHRTAMIKEAFAAENIDVEKAGLHMPIGLSIASETPAEIAVSVLSEIILTLNSKRKGCGYSPDLLNDLEAFERGSGKDEEAVLAVIVEKKGEAPRNPGTKMLIFRDGRMFGTVGGGFAEGEIIRKARQMMQDSASISEVCSLNIHLDGTGEDAMDCGGILTIALERYGSSI